MRVKVYSNNVPVNSPWGKVKFKEQFAQGIWYVSTASHGGIWLSPERRKEMNRKSAFLKSYTWWEEDEDCFIPISFFSNNILSFSPDKERIVIAAREFLQKKQ